MPSDARRTVDGVSQEPGHSEAAGDSVGADDVRGGAASEGDDLTPTMKRTRGPGEQVLRNRADQAARDENDRQRWEKSIEAHIAVHRMALDFLDETHQWI